MSNFTIDSSISPVDGKIGHNGCRPLFAYPGCDPEFQTVLIWLYWIIFIARVVSTLTSLSYALKSFSFPAGLPWRFCGSKMDQNLHKGSDFTKYYCVIALISNITGMLNCLMLTSPSLYGAPQWVAIIFFLITSNTAMSAVVLTIVCWAELAFNKDLSQQLRKQRSNILLDRFKSIFIIFWIVRTLTQTIFPLLAALDIGGNYYIFSRVWIIDWVWLEIFCFVALIVVSRKLMSILSATSGESAKLAQARFKHLRLILLIALVLAVLSSSTHAAIVEYLDRVPIVAVIVIGMYHLAITVATGWFMIAQPSHVASGLGATISTRGSSKISTSDSGNESANHEKGSASENDV